MIGDKNWIANPSKKQLIFFVCLCLIAWVLLSLPMTNYFTESPFKRSYYFYYMLLIASLFMSAKVLRNYFRNKA